MNLKGMILMDIKIRLEENRDFREVENLTREAFWDVYKPGCNEHLVLHKLRKESVFVKELSLVALNHDKIIGNIAYSKSKVINENKEEFEVLCMAPLSVLPDYQGKGIGSLLINTSLKKAKDMGFNGVIIYGNPDYYHKFNFKNAKEYNIKTYEEENFEFFMALELYKDGLKDVSGKFLASEVFNVREKELENFEMLFPYKEKHVTHTQLI